MAKKIYSVDDVRVITIEGDKTKTFTIYAVGTVTSSGWTNPQLVRRKEPGIPENLEFNFVADPPTGISLPVLTPIQTVHDVEVPIGTPVEAIIVYSRTNHIAWDPDQPITTMVVGEEHPVTTQALGEEQPVATQALRTTLIVGEEGPTTLTAGEEHVTTLAIGEEGGGYPFGTF